MVSLVAPDPVCRATAWRAAFGRETAASDVSDVLIALIRMYFTMTFDLGLMPEINAQNLLVERTESRSRPVVRDLGRAERLLHVRRQNGGRAPVVSPTYKVIDGDSDLEFAQVRHSFSFDFKLTYYVVVPFLEAVMEILPDANFTLETVRAYVRDEIARRGVAKWYPDFGASYGHEKVMLTETRPYVNLGRSLLR